MKSNPKHLAPILLYACITGALPGPTASAQTYVFNAASFATGSGATAVAEGDLNSDGKADLVVTGMNGSTGVISVLLGNSDGSFRTHVDYATGVNPKSVIVADLNHDGHLDIATANLDGNSVSILLGNGDGTFSSHTDYATASGPQSIVVGDFNQDGKLDLAIASHRSNSVSILSGNGDGTFQPHVDYPTARFGGPTSITIGDFNKDGKQDLALVNDVDDTLSTLIGNGDGTFQSPIEYPAGFNPAAMVCGDFNRDGNLDIAVADASLTGAQISIFLGNGDGTVQSRVDYPIAGAALSLLAADFNGDGILDLAAGTMPSGGPSNIPSGGTMSVLLGKGDGGFQPHRDFGGVTYSPSMVAADINGDNQPDIALVASQSSVVLLGDGRGNFGSVFDTLAPLGPVQLLAGDFNNDANLDVAYSLNGSGTFSVSLGNGDGTFHPPVNNLSPGGGGALAAGYFNADKNLDIASVIRSEPSPVVLLGQGDGTFALRTSYPIPYPSGALAVGDFNGDHIPDLLVPGSGVISGPSLNVLPGKGDGSFLSPIASAGSSGPGVVADFDHDGKLDYAGLQSNAVGVFLGKGDGSFLPEVDYSTGSAYTAPTAIAPDYFDGNGSIDLAVANAATNDVSVLLGNGDGTFQKAVQFPAVQGPAAIASGDIDGDGKVDLLVSGSGGVSLLLGNGDGTFRAPVTYVTGGATIVAANFTSNSRLDFATAEPYNSNTFSVFINSSAVAITPSSLDFGIQAGTYGNQLPITLFNPGVVPLNIHSILTAGEFTQSNNCPAVLASGANCQIIAQFVPTTSGVHEGTITIADDSPSSPHVIPLKGDAAAAILRLSPASLAFGIQLIGTISATKTVT